MNPIRLVLVFVCAVTALSVAACGGDSQDKDGKALPGASSASSASSWLPAVDSPNLADVPAGAVVIELTRIDERGKPAWRFAVDGHAAASLGADAVSKLLADAAKRASKPVDGATVLARCDRRAPASHVLAIVDGCQLAGVKALWFAVKAKNAERALAYNGLLFNPLVPRAPYESINLDVVAKKNGVRYAMIPKRGGNTEAIPSIMDAGGVDTLTGDGAAMAYAQMVEVVRKNISEAFARTGGAHTLNIICGGPDVLDDSADDASPAWGHVLLALDACASFDKERAAGKKVTAVLYEPVVLPPLPAPEDEPEIVLPREDTREDDGPPISEAPVDE